MIKLSLSAVLILASIYPALAQDNLSNTPKTFNFGIGASNWGIPLYFSIENPIEMENSTIAVGLSYQSTDETEYYWYYRDDVIWRHSIIGIDGSWNYYVDDLLGLPDNLDLYGGLGFGYWIWRTKIKSAYRDFNGTYSGSGSGGLGVSYVVGGRYYFKNRLALNAQFGGGTILSAGKIGLSIRL